MTATLPAEVQHVFDRFITTEFTTVDAKGQPIAWPLTPYYRPGDPCIDVTTGLGYPKKANDARANPRWRRCSPTRPGAASRARPRCSSRGPRTSTTATSTPTRERYKREMAEKLPAAADRDAAEGLRAPAHLVPDAHLHPRAPRAHLRLGATGTRRASRSCSTRTWRRSAPGTPRSPRARTPRRRAARPSGTTAWTSWEPTTRTAVVSLVAPDGFPFSVRLPVEVDRGDAAGAARRRPGGRALAARAGVRSRPRPLARASPGSATSRCAATSSRRTAPGRSSRASWWAASSYRPAGMLSRARLNMKKMRRFRKIAKRELAARGR